MTEPMEAKRCCCCGKPAPKRDPDPWQGRMDSFCLTCAETRCDAFPGSCLPPPVPEKQNPILAANKHPITDEERGYWPDPPPAPVDEGERCRCAMPNGEHHESCPLAWDRTTNPEDDVIGNLRRQRDQALRERDEADKALKRLKEAVDRDALVPYNAGLTARAETAEAQRDAAKNLLRETEAELADVERQREAAWFERDEAHAQRDRYREALERIANESISFIACRIARETLDPPTPPASSEEAE